MKPIINFFASLKSKKRLKLKEFKKEANEFLFRAKRNFSISLRRKEYLEKRYKNEKFAIIYQTPSKKTLTCLSKR